MNTDERRYDRKDAGAGLIPGHLCSSVPAPSATEGSNPRPRRVRLFGLDRDAWSDRRTDTALAVAVRLIKRRLKRAYQPHARIRRAWAEVAPDLADISHVVGYEHNVLRVAVGSAPLRAELQSFRAPDLFRALRATRDGIDVAELRFVLPPKEE